MYRPSRTALQTLDFLDRARRGTLRPDSRIPTHRTMDTLAHHGLIRLVECQAGVKWLLSWSGTVTLLRARERGAL